MQTRLLDYILIEYEIYLMEKSIANMSRPHPDHLLRDGVKSIDIVPFLNEPVDPYPITFKQKASGN